ncbi:uncharacterized protein MONOS_16476 [Monocercomonoides exilis]|uniref:uncharacterized protein n=1 Tax=Monocercomonoides exilis TaxID=2049356 RepID=UPI00355A113F|nr:hypothetical protein MONOS_16476 [Monocercomonoides exilis]|eukprot:MONOS_16476.1-p1 / transcript=MONOS_16476.1 / gene=MONOS_16476 / organism=Monocercomonoides_exilis_PA203 / gene_product=unspecified product / transcript_product=unspecified product / location=Mono_scaffold01778:1036-2014(-) / protein_length=211 / sequence_SO=supercontig / SO=protein_coding / is_pseudo=false
MDFVFVTRKALQFCAMSCIKKLLVAGAAQQSSHRSAPLSSSTGAARRSTSPFRRRRSEEKKVTGDDQPSSSSTPMIDPSDASAVEALFTSARVMDDIEKWLKCEELKNKKEDLEETKANAAQTLSKKDGKCEGHVVELGVEKEELERQIPELMELHEEAKQEMEKRYSEFVMLLQKIRDDEQISKRTSGLVEQLQQNDKIKVCERGRYWS